MSRRIKLPRLGTLAMRFIHVEDHLDNDNISVANNLSVRPIFLFERHSARRIRSVFLFWQLLAKLLSHSFLGDISWWTCSEFTEADVLRSCVWTGSYFNYHWGLRSLDYALLLSVARMIPSTPRISPRESGLIVPIWRIGRRSRAV